MAAYPTLKLEYATYSNIYFGLKKYSNFEILSKSM